MKNNRKIPWMGISGSWKFDFLEIREDVNNMVKELIKSGKGILTGGAFGVDYFATQTVLDNLDEESVKKQLQVFLPVPLGIYSNYLYLRAKQGVVKKAKVDGLISQLETILNISPNCVFGDWGFKNVHKRSYYARNQEIAKNCNELYAFQVNKTKGTQNTIDHARKFGKPVHLTEYTFDIDSGKLIEIKIFDK